MYFFDIGHPCYHQLTPVNWIMVSCQANLLKSGPGCSEADNCQPFSLLLFWVKTQDRRPNNTQKTSTQSYKNSEVREWHHDSDKTQTNKLESWMILKIALLRVKAGVPKTLVKRKFCLHSLYFPQNTLMLTESCGEFSHLHSIFRLPALRYSTLYSISLKCHYNENRIFSKAILNNKQVACMNAIYYRYFQISLFASEIFKFLKYANLPSDDIIHSTKFWSNMMKKDISANLHQNCLILCNKILLNVHHNLSLIVFLPWQHTGFQTSPILKAFLATFDVLFSYLQMVPNIHDPTSL